MATFSTNQARHLYVAKALKSPRVISTDVAGSIAVKSDTAKNHLYFEYMGAGGLTRSDLIDIKNILYAKATDASSLAHKLAKVKVTLDSEVNDGDPVAGQDYILRVAFRNYIGLSEEDQYFKFGMVHAVAGMTASDFYKTLALSLVRNFSREEENVLKFYLETGGNDPAVVAGDPVEVTKSTTKESLDGTYTGLILEEAPQEWILGVMEQVPLTFTVQPDSIVYNGDTVIWGKANKVTSTNSVPDGHKIADLEYFCMGERGDIYRNVGFPHSIRTTYLVDPSIEYNTIDIHYAYVGSNESVQKSEKDITIVVPKVGATLAVSNKLTNDIITAINTATGLNIASLKTA